MVLRLKTRESRSLPGLLKANENNLLNPQTLGPGRNLDRAAQAAHITFKDRKCFASGHDRKVCRQRQKQVTRGGAARSAGNRYSIDCSSASPHQATPDLLPGQKVRSLGDAGWSSPVARQAHNLKAAGSNPAPATKLKARFVRALSYKSMIFMV